MEILVSDLINDSIVDGPGLRMTLFTQGCPHHCPGCHNPSTHSFTGGIKTDTEKIYALFLKNPLLDGLTLSGGEPFSQAAACAHLAEKIKSAGFNVWTYTGYTLEEILSSDNKDWMALLSFTDVLVDGRFEMEKRSLLLPFRGSTNQRLIDVKKSLDKKETVLYEP